MPKLTDMYTAPPEPVLGVRLNKRVPEADQRRQRAEVEELLRRLRNQPGVILADEVGMGKTYVALAVAYGVATRSPRGPVVVMVPANLVDKWVQDLKTFCDLYLQDRQPVQKGDATSRDLTAPNALRYGVARHSVDLMRLLDDPRRERCHLIFLAQGAMARRQTDKWIRLALIAEALRRHGRGRASRLIQVKEQIHRFLGELLRAIGEERAHGWGEDLWRSLLRTDPQVWRDAYNESVRDEGRRLADDPVPKVVVRCLRRESIDLSQLADALKDMPVRARGGGERVSERINNVRGALRDAEERLWKELLSQARWRSPLLVMDEAHHLKNPGTSLARQLQSPDLDQDLRTGDGAMANAFDRMLFLTATPFQLGHHELVRVMERFGDVRWAEDELGSMEGFRAKLAGLGHALTESQRTAIALQRCWSRLRAEDCAEDVEQWWACLQVAERESLTSHQKAVVDAYRVAKRCRDAAAEALRPWILRHNKGEFWVGTGVSRRTRLDGAQVGGAEGSGGLPIPPRQLLPFFLAARSAVNPGQDLLGEALCSSYEAFRLTRSNRDTRKDSEDDDRSPIVDLAHANWYLTEFDRALENCSGAMHPKVDATVRRVVDLWEEGEKVLVFAFYRHTCRALRVHIGREIERRVTATGVRRLREAGRDADERTVERLLERIQDRYFDKADSPGRRALDAELAGILAAWDPALAAAQVGAPERDDLIDVMRRFLRVPTTLVRCFPLAELDTMDPSEAAKRVLDHVDSSRVSWRQKFADFIEFLTERCSPGERQLYLEAGQMTRTGRIRVELDEEDESDSNARVATVANVQVATGKTKRDARARLMRAFNTPFLPDVLVCSQVMGEGVDLQRFCRHVVHHDLDWNPSTIEQRTGRIDRLGCKAQGRHPILLYLPYLAGTADERQFRVMTEREQWFRIVMGQDAVAELITPEAGASVPLPEAVASELAFDLGLSGYAG